MTIDWSDPAARCADSSPEAGKAQALKFLPRSPKSAI
jgi:hypothetical protein